MTRPKKSLGQNFLVDPNTSRKIAAAVNVQPGDIVLEIGPGRGAITGFLREMAGHYIGIELDNALAARWQAEFKNDPHSELLHEDFMNVDLAALAQRFDRPLKLAGNIPYHLTSSIVFDVIKNRRYFSSMTLMIQLEVAQRIVAGPGSKTYGIFSILSQTFADPSLLFEVSRNVFFPKPKVTSAVVQWQFQGTEKAKLDDETAYMQMVKYLFQSRRKMLRTTLKRWYPESVVELETEFDLNLRPEQLSIEEMLRLWEHLRSNIPE
ncbi:ribosomal RNA small subunit methyltransferase A [bacterium]|nr:ribosomal RNA small subunit methyltransferase A [bacterium]